MKYSIEKSVIPSVMIKEKLAESAFHSFSQRGYFATNPDTITGRMNVNRAVFYSYFKNKNDILIYLVNEMTADLAGLLEDERAHKLWLNKNSFKEFEAPFQFIANAFLDHSGLTRAFMQGAVENRALLTQFDRRCRDFSAVFKTKIQSLKKAGRFRGCNAQVVAHIMAIILLSSLFSLSTGVIDCSREEIVKAIALLFYAVLHFDEKQIKKSDSNTPNSEKSRRTRQRILQAAQKLYDQHGHRNVSMEKVAKDAGFTRATLYLYYKTKKDLIEALEREPFDLRENASDKDAPGGAGMDQQDMAPLETKSALTRQKILTEAKTLFADKGYFETTLAAISKKSGYSRSTLYLHFKKKDDIINALLAEMVSEIDPSNLPSILKDIDTTSIDELVRVNNMAIDVFEKDPAVTWIWLQGVFYSPELAKIFKVIYQQLTEPINKSIYAAQKKGKCKQVNAPVASTVILTGACHAIALYSEGFIKCSRNELSLALARIFFGFFNY